MTHPHEHPDPSANVDADLAVRAAVHDANQLLWVIQGQASLLDREGADPTVAAAAQRIAAAARDAAALLRPLLGGASVGDLAAAADTTAGAVCDPLEVLWHCWRGCLAVTEASGRPTVGLRLDAPPPPGPRVGVPDLVAARILMNLLANAVEALGTTGVVTVRVTTAVAAVFLELRDDGPGLPPAVAAAPFDAARGSTKAGGHGIGLAGCRALARDHGGDLDVLPGSGRGAAFRLRLPALPILRLLVVDDEASVREMLAEVCEVEGHQVRLADGSEAAGDLLAGDLLAGEPVDVAIVDLRLPGRSGLDLARDLRGMDPSIGIILMTGWGALADGTDPTVVDFTVAKPLDIPVLQSTLRAAGALRAHRSRGDH